MRTLISLLFILITAHSYAAEVIASQANQGAEKTYPGPNNGWTVIVHNDDTENYSATAKSSSGRVVQISKKPIPREIHVSWLTPKLVELSWPCGSGGCNATIFMSSKGQLSKWFYKIKAVDSERNIVAEAGYDSAGRDVINVLKLFNGQKGKTKIIRLDFAPTAETGNAIESAKFLPNGKLYVSYYSGASSVLISKEIDVEM